MNDAPDHWNAFMPFRTESEAAVHADRARRRARLQIAVIFAVGMAVFIAFVVLLNIAVRDAAAEAARMVQPPLASVRLIAVIGMIALLILGAMVELVILGIRRGQGREMILAEEAARLLAEARTSHAHREHLIRAGGTRLRDFAKLSDVWFWEKDAQLRFAGIDDYAPQTDAVIGGSALGKLFWQLEGACLTEEEWDLHRQDLAARRPFADFRVPFRMSDGQIRHVSCSGFPVFDELGAFTGYRGVARDITTQVAAEAELRAARDRAEMAENLLHDAVNSISEGFVIYDSDDRFVLSNDAYRELYSESADILIPGTPFQEIARRARAKRGQNDALDVATWRRDQLQRNGARGIVLEQDFGNGKWIMATDRRMKNGGVAGLRIDISLLKQAQAALRDSEERLDRAQAIAKIGSWELELATGRLLWSNEMYRMRGLSPDEFEPTLDSIASFLPPEDYVSQRQWLTVDLVAGIRNGPREIRMIRQGGEERIAVMEGRAVIDPDGQVRRVSGTMQDVTERRLMERKLTQVQKMDALGNLTGGMAHDFNNILGVIIGNVEMLERQITPDSMAAELCREALDGANRCADLIRRLLAFARRQSLRPEQTGVNDLVHDITRLLRRTLGEHIVLTLDLDRELWPVMVDAVQLESALVNLATNARDAMPKGGKLDITTRNSRLDSLYATLHPEIRPGDYVLIEISDTGTGIPPDIIGRIFDPFFTTKAPGEGTGLGLSMAFGFVNQSGGHLLVYSEPGLGTTFRIYLPRSEAGHTVAPPALEDEAVPGGDETVLIVEDNHQLRRAAARQLAELGYQVREADQADSALEILAENECIDLLFTDVVMPGTMDGLDLAYRALELRPGIKVVLSSGFPGMRGSEPRTNGSPFVLINKPYARGILARTLRDVLDAAEDGAAGRL
jgi:PAS domain S-box-containing protein